MNKIQKVCGALEIKTASNDKGEYEGYVSIFGNKDHDGDVIVSGAFKEIKTTREGKLKMLMFHDTTLPIGPADFSQDSKGIHVRGKLNMEAAAVKEYYPSIKDGSIDQASVGFNVNPGGYSIEKDANYITDATLWEGSLVTFGANDRAGLTSIKSLENIGIKAFTRFVREALNCSQKEATAIACYGFKGLTYREGSSQPDAAMVDELKQVIRNGFTIKQ